MMPVRSTLAAAMTIVGLVLIVNFKTPDQTRGRSRPMVVAPPTPSAAVPATPAAAAPAAPTPTPAAGYRDGRYTGQDFTNRYGDVQVRVTISGNRITDVQDVQLPSDRQRSAEISQEAGPLLHDEVLQAQSAQIDTISGATYTSDGYAQSVQSALDQARR